jgi:anti-sigma regulatory factor (Ser/Thr protein kinase)
MVSMSLGESLSMIATHNKSNCVTLIITSDAEQVSLLSVALHALCLHASGSEKCALDVQSAVAEALNNVVVHAYDNQPGQEIAVCWSNENRQLRIEIIDCGVSMSFLPEPLLPHFEEEGGRGWWIINACIDEYYYQVIETAEQERRLKPGDKNADFELALPKSHRNILTLIKQF